MNLAASGQKRHAHLLVVQMCLYWFKHRLKIVVMRLRIARRRTPCDVLPQKRFSISCDVILHVMQNQVQVRNRLLISRKSASTRSVMAVEMALQIMYRTSD